MEERERARVDMAEKALREELEASLALKRSVMEREEALMEEQVDATSNMRILKP